MPVNVADMMTLMTLGTSQLGAWARVLGMRPGWHAVPVLAGALVAGVGTAWLVHRTAYTILWFGIKHPKNLWIGRFAGIAYMVLPALLMFFGCAAIIAGCEFAINHFR